MQSGSQLLDRITSDVPAAGPICSPLLSVVNPLARSYWDAAIPLDRERLTPAHCRVLASADVGAYALEEGIGWATPASIDEAFRQSKLRRSQTGQGKRSTPLSEAILAAPVKLLIRDHDTPIQCAVAWEQVYPQRAWVGVLHPHFEPSMAFVIAGILNSAIGQVSYRRLLEGRKPAGHDLRKEVLWKLRVPILAYDRETFDRAATLSYRLHCLYAAKHECRLPAQVEDEDIPSHWEGLLSELVRLYGYREREARRLVENVLPDGLSDVPGAQLKLYYRPRAPLLPLCLFDRSMKHRYDELKCLARSGSLVASDAAELANYRALLAWEDRANRGIPPHLGPSPWPGVGEAADAEKAAYRYLSLRMGQSYRVKEVLRNDPRWWRVTAFREAQSATPPVQSLRTGRPESLTLWINAVSGEVDEAPDAARHACLT